MPPHEQRRFPTPWSFEERAESFVVLDRDKQPILYIYFEDEIKRQWMTGRMGKDDARRIAVNVVRLPELLQIEKQAKSGEFFSPPDGVE